MKHVTIAVSEDIRKKLKLFCVENEIKSMSKGICLLIDRETNRRKC